jgi:hypothetical protein
LTPKTNIFDNVTFDTKEGVEEKRADSKLFYYLLAAKRKMFREC